MFDALGHFVQFWTLLDGKTISFVWLNKIRNVSIFLMNLEICDIIAA